MIITIAVLLVFALITPLFSPYFRGRKLVPLLQEAAASEAPEAPAAEPVSIVIVEHDSAFRLEKVLPQYLSQQYAADYQVIVVIDKNDSESEDVLKRHSDNPHLYYIMLPVTSRYLSRKKLGITLGMRAAKYDWVIVTDVHCAPSSDQWLSHFATHCTPDNNMVLGMTPYEEGTSAYQRFEHLRTMLYHLRQAQKGMPFSTNQSLVALRKGEFFEQKGFSGNLEYIRAEFEFLVNKFAKEGSCALAVEPESWLRQYKPNYERWRMRHLFSIDAFKDLQRRRPFRFLFHLDLWAMHLTNILCLMVVALGVCCYIHETELIPSNDEYLMAWIVFSVAPQLLWIVSLVLRIYLYAPVLHAFDNVSSIGAVLMEWTLSWRNLMFRIRYWLADKNDFITHKL